ncbi:NAD(P)/FAD-dependent oxidoreductase [bacterium]|nr:NAD(P)/FAD-dependent oxidoreductase [bacterium]
MPHSDILVIGGGASGIMAAITAARHGAHVSILERMNRIGKKLLVTGNSRCNLTNLSLHPDHYHGARKAFIEKILKQCNVHSTLKLFQNLGLAWKVDNENRVYPLSEQASSVLDILRFALSHHHVDIYCSAKADRLEYRNHQFIVTLKNHRQFTADTTILAAGGQARKDLGSNGSGFELAECLGHHIISPFPALVKIRCDCPYLKSLKGTRTDAVLTLFSGNEKVDSVTGELMFTEDGLSGIPALEISRHIHSVAQHKKECRIQIDLLPAYPADNLKTDLIMRYQMLGHMTAEQTLITILKKRLIIPVLKSAGISHQIRGNQISNDQVNQLVRVLKGWSFSVTGTRSLNEAQVTAGGVDTEEIDSETLESLLIPGLYFSGEIMDVDGDCGGYNLQWAWSTGYIAGKSAAEASKGG